MKKKILILLAIVMACTVTACATEETEVQEVEKIYRQQGFGEIHIWTDPETNVQYIVYDGGYGGGITPRLSSFGAGNYVRGE